jgi:hypothetical protein
MSNDAKSFTDGGSPEAEAANRAEEERDEEQVRDHRAVVEAVRRLQEAVGTETGPGPYGVRGIEDCAVVDVDGDKVADYMAPAEAHALNNILNLSLPGGE